MKTLLLKYWDRLRSSFWFVPAAMACLAAALAFSTVTLASSQLGPRLLRNYMRDTVNQVVLGTFVATFVYCLLVLRTIRRVDEGVFVPHLSVSIGLLLAMVSVGVLIYFIHHISVSIQADEVVARVCRELEDGIDRLFPEQLGIPRSEVSKAIGETDLPAGFARDAHPVASLEDGYLQLIDADTLMNLASEEDLLLRLERRPGHYLVKGQTLVMVWPADRVNKVLVDRINATFALGVQRTGTQDVEFSFHQLVEIAVRALSPGVNDPFTAIACVDRLGSCLCRLARRDMPSPHRFDRQGQLRLIAPGSTFAGIVDTAFNQIRQCSRSNSAVAIRMLDAIAEIGGQVQSILDASCLQRHADMIVRGAREAVPEANDLIAVEVRFAIATQALCGVHG